MGSKINTKRYVDLAKDKVVSKGESFLQGQDTTAFSKLGKNALELGTTATGAGVLTYEVAKQLTNGEAIAFAESLAATALGDISAETGKLIGEYTGKTADLIASIPGKIAKGVSRRVGEPLGEEHGETPIKSVGEYLADDLSRNSEDRTQEFADKRDANNKAEKIKKTKEEIVKVVNDVNDFIEKANKEIEVVQSYALEGPEFVANKMSDTVDYIIDNVEATLDKSYKTIEEHVNMFCDTEGKKIGSKIVENTNRVNAYLAKQIKNKNEETITRGKIKAKSVLQKAKLFIMGQLGINISIPVSTD